GIDDILEAGHDVPLTLGGRDAVERVQRRRAREGSVGLEPRIDLNGVRTAVLDGEDVLAVAVPLTAVDDPGLVILLDGDAEGDRRMACVRVRKTGDVDRDDEVLRFAVGSEGVRGRRRSNVRVADRHGRVGAGIDGGAHARVLAVAAGDSALLNPERAGARLRVS